MDAKIHLRSRRSAFFEDDDVIDLTAAGRYERTKGGFDLIYPEQIMSGSWVNTTVSYDGGVVTVKRDGDVVSAIVVEMFRRHNCLYKTPFGVIRIGVYGDLVSHKKNERGGELRLKYTLDQNGGELFDTEMDIEYTFKGASV